MTSRAIDATLDASVTAAVIDEPRVLAAYVHGSRARGEERAGSDLDVAILVDPAGPLPVGIEDRLATRIARATGLAVDVAAISTRTPVLAFEVLEGGRRVFARDPSRADEREEAMLRTYLDTAYLRHVQNHYLLGTPL